MSDSRKLIDKFGRIHTNLRLSVTDRCNIRCYYCMPENVEFRPQKEILTFEEIERFIRVAGSLGIDKIRLTGGEPLVRRDLHLLVKQISNIEPINDIALTTNGVLLADHAKSLREAGLQRLNISLDTLTESTFERISRRKGLQKVIDGIDAAIDEGFEKIRLNSIAISGLTETEIIPLAQFARTRKLELRFIEFMPLDADKNWDLESVLTGEKIRKILESEFGLLRPAHRADLSQPAVDFEYADHGQVGFINPVTQPFCRDCNRMRLTAEGKIRNCLFSTTEWDAREIMRNQRPDEDLENLIRSAIQAKKAGHGINEDEFVRPDRAMYEIGG